MVQARENYPALDGLRGVSCICIVMMHMRAASHYALGGYFWNSIIGTWEITVFLFLMLSSFGMCVGYYDRFMEKTIDIEIFYARRYKKLLPFFAVVLFIDVLSVKGEISHVIEAFMKMTMLFGLLPNNALETVGVSWTIGMIFVFYLLFPFFIFVIGNKRRAWISFAIALLIHYACFGYFYTEKFVDTTKFNHNTCFIGYSVVFVAGGLLYLYRDAIRRFGCNHRLLMLIGCVLATVLYYISPDSIIGLDIRTIKRMILFAMVISYGISAEKSLLCSKPMRYMGSISMEIYLAHMAVYRAIEKSHILDVLGNGVISYIACVLLVILGLLVFIEIYKKCMQFIYRIISRMSSKFEN